MGCERAVRSDGRVARSAGRVAVRPERPAAPLLPVAVRDAVGDAVREAAPDAVRAAVVWAAPRLRVAW